MYQLDDYSYDLPQDRIAQQLASPADTCQLLHYQHGTINDRNFIDLPKYLLPESLLIFNNTKVLKARISLWGGKGEVFYLNSHDKHTFEALVRPGKKFKVGDSIELDSDTHCEVVSITDTGRILKTNKPIMDIMDQQGQMPLPPYIEYSADKAPDYQPITAKIAGSVAAPTATLHFTDRILDQIIASGHIKAETTLHVGLGTFKQVDVQDITSYDIHHEHIEVPFSLFATIARQKIAQRPIVAIGTTVTRTLESLPYLRAQLNHTDKQIICSEYVDRWNSLSLQNDKPIISQLSLNKDTLSAETKLFIYPGFSFQIVDQLITNFHLPESSLLMLVAAFVGYDEMQKIYEHAIAGTYQFYSLGDTMLLQQ